MNRPNYVVRCSERTREGSLSTSLIQRARVSLLNRGFILLPSDTCYSIATLAIDKKSYSDMNILLNRDDDEPVLLSFSNLRRVEKFVCVTPQISALFEAFTPGPLTLVCNSQPNIPEELTFRMLGTNEQTIGVRIPDSAIEREIASCTDYPITAIAVRDPTSNSVVKDFSRAIEIIADGMEKLKQDITWGLAIEGSFFRSSHSTIIRVGDISNGVNLLREGDISFDEIKLVANEFNV